MVAQAPAGRSASGKFVVLVDLSVDHKELLVMLVARDRHDVVVAEHAVRAAGLDHERSREEHQRCHVVVDVFDSLKHF